MIMKNFIYIILALVPNFAFAQILDEQTKQFLLYRNLIHYALIFLVILFTTLFLWNTFRLFRLKKEDIERIKVLKKIIYFLIATIAMFLVLGFYNFLFSPCCLTGKVDQAQIPF